MLNENFEIPIFRENHLCEVETSEKKKQKKKHAAKKRIILGKGRVKKQDSNKNKIVSFSFCFDVITAYDF